MGKKKHKNKKQKLTVVFDEKERKEYLLGFRKRNLEKKLKAKERLLKKMKEKKKELKKEANDKMSQLYLNQRAVPEVQHLVEPVVYELPNHSITITHLDANEIGGDIGYTLGSNKSKK